MHVYEQEIKDGCGDIIANSSRTIAYESPLKKKETDLQSSQANKWFEYFNSQAGENKLEQPDLYEAVSVLVSTGWNCNDDVFHPDEVWVAKSSPIHKQVNFMHKQNDIIGVITDSYAFALDGTEIVNDDYPSQYDVLADFVIYKRWQDEQLQERMDRILAEIDENKWFVSMECLFKSFDYAFASEDFSENFIVPRDEATAYLSKHLKAFGGDGTYNGYRIGRLLRQITFSGKGLVDNPANPRSVIFNDTNIFEASATTKASINSGDNENMTVENTDSGLVDKLQAKVEDLESKLAEANTKVQEKAEKKIEDYENKISELNISIASKDEKIEGLEEVVAKSAKEKETLTKEIETLTEKNQELVTASVKQSRVSKLVTAGVELEKAETVVEKWASASDEQFEDIVELTVATIEKPKTEEKPEEKEETETKAETKTQTPEEFILSQIEEDEHELALASAGNSTDDDFKELQSEMKALAKNLFNRKAE